MIWSLRFHPAVEADLDDMADFLFDVAGRATAEEKLDIVQRGIDALLTLPHKGSLRHEIAWGLRAVPVDGAVVAFVVNDDLREVLILSVTWGGADWMQRVQRRT